MASDQNFVDFVLNQLEGIKKMASKNMFGEYGIWADGKIFALICGNKLFIKPTEAGRAFIGEPTEAPPYPPKLKIVFLSKTGWKTANGCVNCEYSEVKKHKDCEKNSLHFNDFSFHHCCA